MELTAMQVLILAIWGMAVSFIEERIGKFADIGSAGLKQVINATFAWGLPAVLTWVGGWWKPEFGDAQQVVTSLFYLFVPVVAWLVSQIAHYADKWLKKVSATKKL